MLNLKKFLELKFIKIENLRAKNKKRIVSNIKREV